MNAIKASLATSLAHGSKILLGFITIKLIAIYLGPEGIGRLGNFMSLMTVVSVLAGGGILSGVIKYVSDFKNSPYTLINFISTAVTYALSFSTFVFVVGLIFIFTIANIIFGDESHWPIIVGVLVAQIFLGLTNVVVGVVNGYRDTAKFAAITVSGVVLAVPVVFFSVKYGGHYGGALALVISYIASALPSAILAFKSKITKAVRLKMRQPHIRNLSKYSIMLFFSAMMFPVSEIIIRNLLIDYLGFSTVGLWQAVMKISSVYLSFFSLFLGYYYMPQISGVKDKKEVNQILLKYLPYIAGIFFIFASVIYLLRDFVIQVALSSEFISANKYLGYQLIGDGFKVIGFVFGFVGVAKAATKIYIAAEILQGVLFVGLTYYFVGNGFGILGVFYAYMLTAAGYLTAAIITYSIYLKKNNSV